MDTQNDDPISVLCLGPRNAGKTTLIKRLQDCEGIDVTYSAVPTVGTNIFSIKYESKNGRPQSILVREVGGEMSPLWKNYFDYVKKVMYVVDTSNLCQISAAAVFLYTLLAEPKLTACKFILVLTKMDVAYRQMRNEALLMMQLNRLQKEIPQQIIILETSAMNGEGIPKLKEWITGIKIKDELYG